MPESINPIPMLDIPALHAPIQRELEAAVLKVLRHGNYINGSEVADFEGALARAVNAKHAIGISSGTDALLVSLMALNVAPGDKIITTTYSFFSTAGVIARLGAIPVFVDIDAGTFNLNVSQIEAAVDSQTVGIIPVHLFGNPAPIHAVDKIAKRHGLWVLEDAAQALGAKSAGIPVGTLGEAGIYSFFPAKNLGAAGDGGAVVTNDSSLAERIKQLRAHGAQPKYHHELVGGNFRLDTLQAALLNVKLPHLLSWNRARWEAAKRYDVLLSNSPNIVLPTPTNGPNNTHAYNQYVIRTTDDNRDRLQQLLSAHKIGNAVYYPTPLHLQPCFQSLGYAQGTLPHSENAAKTSLALPMNPTITSAEQERIAQLLATN